MTDATAYHQKVMALKARLKKKDAEIERLRAALRLIADGKESEPRILARAALEGKE